MNMSKRFLCLVFAIVMMAIMLAACNKDNQQQEQENDNQPQKLVSADWNTLPEYSKTYPTPEEIVVAYKQANDPFCWFVNTKLPPLDLEDKYVYDGIPYYRVLSDDVVNLETLEKYLTLFYDNEYVSLLMDVNVDIQKFIEDENGNLYCNSFVYTPEGFGQKEEYAVEKNSDTSYTLTVSFDRLKEDGSYRSTGKAKYVYEKIDGRWVFSTYRVFRQ